MFFYSIWNKKYTIYTIPNIRFVRWSVREGQSTDFCRQVRYIILGFTCHPFHSDIIQFRFDRWSVREEQSTDFYRQVRYIILGFTCHPFHSDISYRGSNSQTSKFHYPQWNDCSLTNHPLEVFENVVFILAVARSKLANNIRNN